ncbi:MAG: transcription elongation factor GreA [Patescibacteria group bacterium]|nr:transcription elongation factor GreA [Patescibacteria group bacterium]
MQKEYITLEKKAELEKELVELTTTKRKEVADALEYAKSLGDLSENAEYNQAREDQAHLEDRIREVENTLKNAEIATGTTRTGKIEVGSTVVVTKVGDKTERTFLLVGSEEADIEQGKVSNESPLGDALLGHEKGDKVTFKSPNGQEISYTIKSVE